MKALLKHVKGNFPWEPKHSLCVEVHWEKEETEILQRLGLWTTYYYAKDDIYITPPQRNYTLQFDRLVEANEAEAAILKGLQYMRDHIAYSNNNPHRRVFIQ